MTAPDASLTKPEIWVLSDCAKPVIEIASDNAASNPNPRLFATTLLILVLIGSFLMREGRKGGPPSPSSLHDRRPGRTIKKSDPFIRRKYQPMKDRLTV